MSTKLAQPLPKTPFSRQRICPTQRFAHLGTDDSGLEIDALQGRHWVYSARYGGKGLSEKDRYEWCCVNCRKPLPHPGAPASAAWLPWQCPMAKFTPWKMLKQSKARSPTSGEHGFGYDPIFFVPEFNATMAQLPKEVKNQINLLIFNNIFCFLSNFSKTRILIKTSANPNCDSSCFYVIRNFSIKYFLEGIIKERHWP